MYNRSKYLLTSMLILLGVSTLAFAASPGVDSPAIRAGNLVFISGQGAGSTKQIANSYEQIEEAFKKLRTVAIAEGGNLDDIVKINVYLTDLADYDSLNKITKKYFKPPYPARSTVGVSSLPKGHRVEIDAIMSIKTKAHQIAAD